MPIKKAKKTATFKEHKDAKVAFTLRMSGIIMMVTSLFMVAVPFMYRGTYAYLTNNTNIPRVDNIIDAGIGAGIVFSLIYCLVGVYVFRAGEEGTFLAKGLCMVNNAVWVLALIATVFMFLPIPDQTFNYAVELYSSTTPVQTGMVPMGILTIIDMACIIGLTGSVALIDNICVFKKGK